MPHGDDEMIRRLLADTRVWAVVGLSDNPSRPAFGVARVLQDNGKQIVPVHPKAGHLAAAGQELTVHGEKAYGSLADIPFPVDVVDVFVNSERAGEVADQAVEIGAGAVWFQLGVVDEEAYERTTAAGLDMVMDHCPAIELSRLG